MAGAVFDRWRLLLRHGILGSINHDDDDDDDCCDGSTWLPWSEKAREGDLGEFRDRVRASTIGDES